MGCGRQPALSLSGDAPETAAAQAARCAEANPVATAIADYHYDEQSARGCTYHAKGRLCAIDERRGH